MECACFFHDTDTPVEIGGKAVFQVIRLYQGVAGEESLMADQHSFFEAFPCQCFGGGEPAHTQEVPVFVYDGCFSVEDIGQFVAVDAVYHLLQGVILVKTVARIQEAEIIAAGKGDSFVHGIIQSFVRFAHYGVYPRAVAVDDR